MEFSLFLVIFSIALLILFWVSYFIMKLTYRSDVMLYAMTAIAVAATVFFKWWGAALLLLMILELLAKKVPFFKQDNRAIKYGLFFLAIMGCLLAAYLPWVNVLWEDKIAGWVMRYIGSSKFVDVFMVGRFFRFYYPAAVAGILHLAFRYAKKEKENHYTFWYRFLRSFDHRQVFMLLAGIASAGLAYLLQWNAMVQVILVNFLLFVSWPYVYYGFATMIYGIRRLKISYFLSIAILFLFIVISGPIFIFTLILIMGIGVSDIWMNYHKRKIKLF